MNDLYERPTHVSGSAKAGKSVKLEQPVKHENIENAEAALPKQVATELTIDTTIQPIVKKSVSKSPNSALSSSKHSNGDCSMDADQASCSEESKTNGDRKSAEISPQGLEISNFCC